MERLIGDGVVDAVLDVTTTELADELVGGELDAGPENRLAPHRAPGTPHVVVPGTCDMANFGTPREFRRASTAGRSTSTTTMFR